MRPDKLYKHTLCCLYPDVLNSATGNRIRNMVAVIHKKRNRQQILDKTRQRMFPDFPELLLESESQKAETTSKYLSKKS